MLDSGPYALVRADLERVEEELKRRIASETSIFPEIAQYALFAGGKRIRPAMFLLAMRMCRQAERARGDADSGNSTGGSGASDTAVEESSIATAAVFELIHAASLLHDDVIDEANLRRGRTAVNAYWGNKKCILLGDYLFLKGILAMVESGQTHILPVILSTITAMIEGEGREVDLKYRLDVTERECIEVCELKTAILFANACKLGAILAGATDDDRDAFFKFGMSVGVAFQLFDDILDYTGTSEALGKTELNDFDEGKPTVPLLHAFQNAEPQDREYLSERYLDQTHGRHVDTDRLLAIMTNTGALDHARARAQETLDVAKAAIARFPDTPEKAAMLELSDFVLARKS